MTRFIIRRLYLAALTIFSVSVIVFVAARLAGDVTYLLVPMDAPEEMVREVRARYGLDQPLWVQYQRFAFQALQGDLGVSLRYHDSAIGHIFERLPATIELALTSFVAAMTLGVVLGIFTARNRGTAIDAVVRASAVLCQSAPHFWIGIMAVLVFAVQLKWLPTGGRAGIETLILPAATLAMFPTAAIMRLTRSTVLAQLDTEFVKFLRVKGISERRIMWRHVLRNSLVPVVALAGIQLGNLLGGTVIVEAVFTWPGLGSLMMEAISNHDYPMIQAGVLVTSFFFVMLNLAVDLLFGLIDPRIRY